MGWEADVPYFVIPDSTDDPALPSDRGALRRRGLLCWRSAGGRSGCWRLSTSSGQAPTSATALIQPALARSIFTGKQLSVQPLGGRAARPVSFSIW